MEGRVCEAVDGGAEGAQCAAGKGSGASSCERAGWRSGSCRLEDWGPDSRTITTQVLVNGKPPPEMAAGEVGTSGDSHVKRRYRGTFSGEFEEI